MDGGVHGRCPAICRRVTGEVASVPDGCTRLAPTPVHSIHPASPIHLLFTRTRMSHFYIRKLLVKLHREVSYM